MTLGLLLTSVVLGMRHGIDWDHIAAVSDLVSAAETRRRGLLLSFLYAIGHAAVVFVLGALLIVAGRSIPEGLSALMGRIVGLTLIFLGAWILVQLLVRRREFRLQSRWMIILNGTFAGFRRVRGNRVHRHVDLDHEHHHDHPAEGDHDGSQAHDHPHLGASATLPAAVTTGAVPDPIPTPLESRSTPHSHPHRHRLVLPTDPAAGYGGRTAAGIGMLHGVGVESPTQIALFVASTSVTGAGFGLLLLAAWIVGLVSTNMAMAVLAGSGLLHAERNFGLYAAVAVAVGLLSIAMGLTFVFGLDLLPEIRP